MAKYGLLTERDSREKHKNKAPKCMTFRGFTFINYLTVVVFLPSFIFLSVPCLSL